MTYTTQGTGNVNALYRSGLMLKPPVRGHESVIVRSGDELVTNAKGRIVPNPSPTLPTVFQCRLCWLPWPLHLPPVGPCRGRARAIGEVR